MTQKIADRKQTKEIIEKQWMKRRKEQKLITTTWKASRNASLVNLQEKVTRGRSNAWIAQNWKNEISTTEYLKNTRFAPIKTQKDSNFVRNCDTRRLQAEFRELGRS